MKTAAAAEGRILSSFILPPSSVVKSFFNHPIELIKKSFPYPLARAVSPDKLRLSLLDHVSVGHEGRHNSEWMPDRQG
jgi:hypothetical protein